MYGLNHTLGVNKVKNLNKHMILDLIRFTPGGISRAELARQVGVSRSAVTSIIQDLLETELVHETESAPSSSGRRPIMLEINAQRGYVVGVDMGVSHLGVVLTDLSARVLQELEVSFDVSLGPNICLDQVEQNLLLVLERHGILLRDVLSIAIGVPGPIATKGGAVVTPPIMPGWDGFPIRLKMQERFGIPVSVNNDAELGALGEWAYGAGRGESNLVYVKVGSGVGAGLMLGDAIYHGSTGIAGEIGHITLQDDGPLCTCGNRGCLEALAGGRAIARQGREAVLNGQRTLLSSVRPVEQITAMDVNLAARKGDLVAQEILASAGWNLGTAIASLINLFNPGIVVVGGGVSQAGDLILEPIRRVARERCLRAAAQNVRITAAILGRRSSSMGAVVQALSVVLHELSDGT